MSSRTSPDRAPAYHVRDGQKITQVRLERDEDLWRLSLGDAEREADIERIGAECLSLVVNGESFRVHYLEDQGGKTVLCVRGEYYELEVLDEREWAMQSTLLGTGRAGAGGAGQVRSNIPGKVIEVLVREGDSVERDQKLLVLEAMKMENEIRAGSSGVVTRVLVARGDTVETNALMIELEPRAEGVDKDG